MTGELGGFLGWLLIISFAGTILNYCVKLLNKYWGKKIVASPIGKKVMHILLLIFVQNHKYFGMATFIFLILHFLIQFNRIGLSVTGAIAAFLLLLQILIGLYANLKKKPRKGLWFAAHRTIAVLIVLGFAAHLLSPSIVYMPGGFSSNKFNYAYLETIENSDAKISDTEVSDTEDSDTDVLDTETTDTEVSETESADTENLQSFTLEELSQYDGKNGNKAYIAYNGLVYDVTNVSAWKNGSHNGHQAGTDLTDVLKNAPHGTSVIDNLEVVGKLVE